MFSSFSGYNRAGSLLFTGCLFFLTTLFTFGQKYNILNYSAADGLPSQIVNDVFQDKNGYLWFATQSGVCKFNGLEFTDFIPENDLDGVDAVSIVEDQNGRICIGTNTSGLFVFDKTRTLKFNSSNGLPTNVIRRLYLDKSGLLWVLTEKGVFQLHDNKLIPFKDPRKTFDSGVLSMTETQDGEFWFGTQGNGLVHFNRGKFQYFAKADGITDDYIFSLNTWGDSLLIGTTNQGVLIGEKGKFTKLPVPEMAESWISAMLPSGDGIRIISSVGLVDYFRSGNYSLITEKNGLASNDLYNGYLDREKNLWITSGNGVSCLKKEGIISADRETGLSTDKITCLARLKSGFIAAGTSGSGINILRNNASVSRTVLPPELQNVRITCLFEDQQKKELWVGTDQSGSGIIILDTDKERYTVKRVISKLNDTEIQTVTRIDKDKQGKIWVSTFNAGIFLLDDEKVKHYNSKNGLPSDEVYTFTLDKDGIPWVSIYQKGVYKQQGNRFVKAIPSKKLDDRFVLSMTSDKDGNLYIGTKTKGLYIYANGKLSQYTRANGLLSNTITGLILSGNELWIGTNRGVNLLRKVNTGQSSLVSFDSRAGLNTTEIQENAMLSDAKYIWIGSTKGISRLDRTNGNYSLIRPLIKLQSVKLFFEETDWSKKKGNELDQDGIPVSLELSHTDNHLTFRVSAQTNSSVFYSYMLEGTEGIESQWSPLSDENEVTYSNLNPGTYTFKVKSVNNYGLESVVLEIPIIILPPFWQTWWFRILIISIIVIVIIAVVRVRERNFRERQLELEQTVKERTHEVVAKNKEILDSITYAKRIQSAMLPGGSIMRKEFSDIFVLYQPKDIVAGDFYWLEKTPGGKLIAVADCTGHGVPGAMISVVCNNALNRAAREYGILQPAAILDKTRELIEAEFAHYEEDVKDGMDISLLYLPENKGTIQWAGANISLWILRKETGEIEEVKCDKQPVSKHFNSKQFTNHELSVQEGDIMYLFSDGFADQFGGEKGKKLKSNGFREILRAISHHSMDLQEIALKEAFDEWKGSHEQIDDVCVIGIKVV